MTKYQEALNNIVDMECDTTCSKCKLNKMCNSHFRENVDTLQELIDNYELFFKGAMNISKDNLKLANENQKLKEEVKKLLEKQSENEKKIDKALEIAMKRRN